MSKYDVLTKFIPVFETVDFHQWADIDPYDKISPKKFEVNYDKSVNEFVIIIHQFVEEQAPYAHNYMGILEKQNIKINSDSNNKNIIDKIDDKTTIALIIGLVRSERFGYGNLRAMLANGTILELLRHLAKFEK